MFSSEKDRGDMVSAHHAQCIAHQGGAQLAPGNTLAAFRNALAFQVDAIELDVHRSRDGHLVVFHDNTVERGTDGEGNILDLDFMYLRSLNAASQFHGHWPERVQMPTLREVLDLAKGRAQVFIEIKLSKRNEHHGYYPNIVETVMKDVRATGMVEQVVVISFGWELLGQAKTVEPTIQTGMIVGKELWDYRAEGATEALLEQATSLKSDWIDIEHDLLTPERAQAIHHADFKVAVWTVNSQEELRHYRDMGVDAVTTDRPDLWTQL